MPRTKPQSALVYALNAMLLLNLTVIIVMLSGTGPTTSPQPVAANDGTDRVEPQRREASFGPAVQREPLAVTEPLVVQVSAAAQEQATIPEAIEAISVVSAAVAEPRVSAEAAAVFPEPEPVETEEPPVTFFGVGLD